MAGLKTVYKTICILLVVFCMPVLGDTISQKATELAQSPEQLRALLKKVNACRSGLARIHTSHDINSQAEQQLAKHYGHKLLDKVVSYSGKNRGLVEVLDTLFKQADVDYLLDEDLLGAVPQLHITNKRLGDALATLFQATEPRMALRVVHNVVTVAPYKKLLKKVVQHLTSSRRYSHMVTLPLSFLVVTEQVKLELQALWQHCCKKEHSAHSFFYFDKQHNTLCLGGNKATTKLFVECVKKLDTPPQQVQLDVWLMLFSTSGGRHTGFDWLIRTYKSEILDKIKTWQTQPLASYLDFVLTVAEEHNHAKTLLRPSIIAQDGQMATIVQGKSVPIETQTEDIREGKVRTKNNVHYKDVGITLKATPRVSADKRRITLDVFIENATTVDKNNTKYPELLTAKTKTRLTLQNGKVVVISGLLQEKKTFFERFVPYLTRIPILNWFFRSRRKSRMYSELVIFIAARTC